MRGIAMLNVFLKKIAHLTLPNHNQKIPRNRFIDYYQDLPSSNISRDTFYEGGQYSFVEIADLLIQSCNQDDLLNIDMLMCTYWAHEFDPDHSSCAPYLKNKYDLGVELFEVSDQGSLASFSGFHIIKKYLEKGIHKKAILLALEQTTIPRDKNLHDIIPEQNGGFAFLLDSKPKDAEFQLQNLMQINIENLDKVIMLIKTYQTGNKKICLSMRKSSVLHKYIKANHYQLENCLFEYYESEFSTLTPFTILSRQRDKKEISHLVIYEEDIESLDLGVLVLKLL